jgi:hypothetical protein
MPFYTRHLRQDVTHWPVTGTDGFGGFTYGTPILLKARWEYKRELFLNEAGEEVTSEAIVYLGVDTDMGDFLALDDHTAIPIPSDLGSPARAWRIRGTNKTTDLRNLDCIRKVFL